MRDRFYAAMKAAGMAQRCGRKNGITFHSLRHTFGTRMAAAGVPLRTLQEWMGHKDHATTQRYADYAPDPTGAAALVARAFEPRINPRINLSASESKTEQQKALWQAETGLRASPATDLITQRSRVRIPPPLLESPAIAGLSASHGRPVAPLVVPM